MPERTALITGATGLVGSHCLRLLLQDSSFTRVIALTRHPLPFGHPRLDARPIDFDKLNDALEGVQAESVFCCLGTTIKKAGSQAAFRRVDHDYPLLLAEWAARSGAQQYLLVSAMGADAESGVFYNRVKGETEKAIAAQAIPSIIFFRPSLLLGERSERRWAEEAGALLFRLLPFIFRGPLAKYRPNEAEHVAQAMLAHTREANGGLHIVPAAEMHGEKQ